MSQAREVDTQTKSCSTFPSASALSPAVYISKWSLERWTRESFLPLTAQLGCLYFGQKTRNWHCDGGALLVFVFGNCKSSESRFETNKSENYVKTQHSKHLALTRAQEEHVAHGKSFASELRVLTRPPSCLVGVHFILDHFSQHFCYPGHPQSLYIFLYFFLRSRGSTHDLLCRFV